MKQWTTEAGRGAEEWHDVDFRAIGTTAMQSAGQRVSTKPRYAARREYDLSKRRAALRSQFRHVAAHFRHAWKTRYPVNSPA
jgi:hypothetical protein